MGSGNICVAACDRLFTRGQRIGHDALGPIDQVPTRCQGRLILLDGRHEILGKKCLVAKTCRRLVRRPRYVAPACRRARSQCLLLLEQLGEQRFGLLPVSRELLRTQLGPGLRLADDGGHGDDRWRFRCRLLDPVRQPDEYRGQGPE